MTTKGQAFRRYLLTSTVAAGSVLALAGSAHAADAAAAASADTTTTLGDLIVTAQKREENIQSVPAAVQAITTARIEQLHIENFNDYIKYLPSVSYQSIGPGYANVYMRGVAADNQSNHSGSLPAVGIYLDEQPITTVGGPLDIHTYDIARVESLAGPQGTLYGASSMAGTIRIITNKPQLHDFKAAYDVEVNPVDHGGTGYMGEGFVNVPVGDHAAVRLVGWYENDAGYIDNVPGTRSFSTGVVVNNNAFVKNDYNTARTYGGRLTLKFDVNDNWTVTPMIMAQDQRSNGVFGFDPKLGDLKVQHFTPEFNHDSWYQAALTIEGKIANLDVTYSGGHMDRRIASQSDYTDYSFFYDQLAGYAAYFYDSHGNFINPIQTVIGRDHFTKDNHELRFASPQGERFRILAGLFYQRQTHYILQNYFVGPTLATSVDNWPGTFWLTDQMRIDRDYAAFGEASFDITDKLTLTGGLRVFKSDNTLQGFYGFNAPNYSHTGESQCFAPTTVDNGPCTNLNKEVKYNGETHKVNLTYHIDSEKLIYATYSTGFRPGGVNRNGNLPPYRPDFLSNYELGWKTTWLDGAMRWNGAVYYERWRDFQFSYLGPNSLTVVNNAGNANIYGIESDITWRVSSGLTLTGAASYNDAKLAQDFCSGVVPCTGGAITAPAGQQLPVTPRFKANGTARYEFDAAGMRAHVQGAVVYQSSSWSDLLTLDRNVLGVQKAYATADFTAGVTKDSWSLEFSLLNAFDTRNQLYRYAECTIKVCGGGPNQTDQGTVYTVPSRPRTFAVRFGQKF
jgi:iron complex outermembrane receptor protein